MSTVLDSIIEGVREDLARRKISPAELQEQISRAPTPRDAYAALAQPGMNIIAEVKRSSPSKGDLAPITDPASLAERYEFAGASVISVLTEERRFKGSIADFEAVRARVDLPLLRKDFVITEYQARESRAIGADLQLLIVAALSQSELKDFYDLSYELGMKVLVEVHNEEELERALEINAQIIGVNARNLKTRDVDPGAFAHMLPRVPVGHLKVAESGIALRSEVEAIEDLGGNAILVGETLVKAGDPATGISMLLGR